MTGFLRKQNVFIERSLSGALCFFRDSVLSDEYASRAGFLQSLDPRVKTVTFAGFIGAVMFMKDVRLVFLAYLFSLALAAVSRIGFLFFLKRTWIFIPLFSLFIAVPSLFSGFTPGETVAVLPVFGKTLTVTRPGLDGAVLFVARVLASVSLAILLTLTTRASGLFAALRWLGVPQVFVMTLNMCYRYIFLFAGIILDMHRAMKSRTGGKMHYRRGQKIVSWNIANLWVKSVQMNQQVYDAMLSRGYDGEAKVMRGLRTTAVDWWWAGFSAALVCVSIIVSTMRQL